MHLIDRHVYPFNILSTGMSMKFIMINDDTGIAYNVRDFYDDDTRCLYLRYYVYNFLCDRNKER